MSKYPAEYYHQYTPLPPRFIRLLRIHPNPGYRDSSVQLKIELKECLLDAAEYDALSYTWGPATLEEQEELSSQIFTTVARCYPVLCNGKIIPVTRSLRNALFRLRYLEDPEMAENHLSKFDCRKLPYIWIDGLCINQDDPEERNQQVALMAELYSKANLTIAYLGEPDEHTLAALQTALMLARLFEEVKYEMETLSIVSQEDPVVWVNA